VPPIVCPIEGAPELYYYNVPVADSTSFSTIMYIYNSPIKTIGNQVAQLTVPDNWNVAGNYFGFKFSAAGPTYVAPVSAYGRFAFPGDQTFIIP
jgi:hypothetical protein